MVQYRLANAAQSDILNILTWSHAQFGGQARARYEALIVAALRDIGAQPDRPGSIKRPELGAEVRSWHLRLSRERVRTAVGVVRNPRHFLMYRPEPGPHRDAPDRHRRRSAHRAVGPSSENRLLSIFVGSQ